jgi:hypothetical protein
MYFLKAHVFQLPTTTVTTTCSQSTSGCYHHFLFCQFVPSFSFLCVANLGFKMVVVHVILSPMHHQIFWGMQYHTHQQAYNLLTSRLELFYQLLGEIGWFMTMTGR